MRMHEWRALQKAKRKPRFAIHLASYNSSYGVCGRYCKGTVRVTQDRNAITCRDCTKMLIWPYPVGQSITAILKEKSRLNKLAKQHPLVST